MFMCIPHELRWSVLTTTSACGLTLCNIKEDGHNDIRFSTIWKQDLVISVIGNYLCFYLLRRKGLAGCFAMRLGFDAEIW
jgi:hypothetical protein